MAEVEDAPETPQPLREVAAPVEVGNKDNRNIGERGDSEISIWKLTRYRMAMLVFWGFAIVYALRSGFFLLIVNSKLILETIFERLPSSSF